MSVVYCFVSTWCQWFCTRVLIEGVLWLIFVLCTYWCIVVNCIDLFMSVVYCLFLPGVNDPERVSLVEGVFRVNYLCSYLRLFFVLCYFPSVILFLLIYYLCIFSAVLVYPEFYLLLLKTRNLLVFSET